MQQQSLTIFVYIYIFICCYIIWDDRVLTWTRGLLAITSYLFCFFFTPKPLPCHIVLQFIGTMVLSGYSLFIIIRAFRTHYFQVDKEIWNNSPWLHRLKVFQQLLLLQSTICANLTGINFLHWWAPFDSNEKLEEFNASSDWNRAMNIKGNGMMSIRELLLTVSTLFLVSGLLNMPRRGSVQINIEGKSYNQV